MVINDDPYFWTNKFIEMVIVLVEIRKSPDREDVSDREDVADQEDVTDREDVAFG